MSISLKYPHLFSPLQVGRFTFKNRVISAPMLEMGVFRDGAPTDKADFFYGRRAQGGAAAVTLGESQVNGDLAIARTQTMCLRDITDREDGFRRVVTSIHRHGALASIQLLHAGMASKIATIDPVGAGVTEAYGPSAFTRADGVRVLEMTEDIMREIAEDFAVCAANAKFLGFDMIQIHGGHGWLFSQFTSPLVNRRTDKYGGSIENRARFPRMVLQAIRDKVGYGDFLIEYRLSGDDMQEGGMGIDETVEFAKQIEDLVDIIHVSAGTMWDPHSDLFTFPMWFMPHGINVENAGKIRAAVTKCRVSVVGAINTPEMAEQIIAEGKADFVCLNRPLLADPDWCRKAMEGRAEEIRPCVRCLSCHDRVDLAGCTCAVNPENGPELLWNASYPKAQRSRKVIVIGGGVGGMQAAVSAARAGHQTVLLESEDRLGGTLNFTDHSPIKQDLRRFKDYLSAEVSRAGVEVRLNCRATPELVEAEKADVVIAALGAEPIVPRIPGIDGENVMSVLEGYRALDRLGQRVAVIGGNLSGVEFGLDAAERGRQVTIVEMADAIAPGAPRFYGAGVRMELKAHEASVNCRTGAVCTAITEDGVVIRNQDGREETICADSVVYAVGMRARGEQAEQFRRCAYEFRSIGDCQQVARVKQAVEAGFWAGNSIY